MSEVSIYRSSNGDDWILETGLDGSRVVLHRANPSSGGKETRMAVEEFLQRGGGGPEVAAVRQAVGGSDSSGLRG
ncbi:hypothetical protein [Mangrovicella endophytica]|uniref:hypothetical protein n=1 Tax=Mangrovicella endophytica TaxID=2066697 RepID=UPI000C9DAC75|nr:hypothetical protein [Mangrovicella endophytica]